MVIPSRIQELGDALAGHSGPCKIVVADDDPLIVRLLQESLQELGHQVLCAYDGQMAIRLARQHRPQLIVLDVNMPMTSGLKAFEYLRASGETDKIPVIFVTGELSNDVYPSVAHAPRVAHVKKPFDLDSFNSLVQHFLDTYPARQ